MDLFKDLASTATKKVAKAVDKAKVDRYTRFMELVDQCGLRISYESNSYVCGQIGLCTEAASTVTNGGTPSIGHLPLRLQALVCKKNGSYAENANTAAWRGSAPAGYEARGVIQVVAIAEAWNRFLAHEAEQASAAE